MKGYLSREILHVFSLSVVLLLACFCVCFADPTPVTITLQNGLGGYNGCEETCLSQENPTYNYGNSDEVFWVQKYTSAGDDWTAVIRFDLTGVIPSNACIKSAKLKLYQWQTFSMSNDYLDVAVYRCLVPWVEGTGGDEGQPYAGACWYYRSTNPIISWSSAGARGSNTDRNDSYDDVQRCTEGTRWVVWDVTPSVQYWHRNPSANYGFVLDWTEVGISFAGVNFRTSEWGSDRPILEITYVIPEPEPTVTLSASVLGLNYWDSDPNITASTPGSAKHILSGTTSVSGWGWDGSRTTSTYSSSFECSVKVKLEDGIVDHDHGTYSFKMWTSDSTYIQLQAVYGGFYEISGQCAASGNGERHDGTSYWSSYWDAGSYGILPFTATPEDEETEYLTWKLRYDKTNQMFYVYVNDTLVTYYSNVNFSNWRLGFGHANDVNGVDTVVRTQLYDEANPPTPNPMTWSTQPYALTASSITMVASTATDSESPPVEYYFEETTGQPGGTSSGWQSGTNYTDVGLSENTQYAYRVKARDSAVPPNPNSWSTTVPRYTLMNPPTGIQKSNVTTSTIDLTAQGTLPNLELGQSGVYFEGLGAGGLNEWIKSRTDQATDLSANTQYNFRVKARNGDGIETTPCAWVGIYSGMPRPERVEAKKPTATTVDLEAFGEFPNLSQAQSGVYFECPGAGGINTWIKQTTATATNLTPNTEYTFKVKSRNGDAVETEYAPVQATIRTLAAVPAPRPYDPIGCHTVQANWGANGNPPGTEYFCRELVTGKESGWITGTSWVLSSLQEDVEYRFLVKARNAEGKETEERDLGPVRTSLSIGGVKQRYVAGQRVNLNRKVVTAIFEPQRLIFVQDMPIYGEEQGSSGIGIRYTTPPPFVIGEGTVINVVGVLAYNDEPDHENELLVLADDGGITQVPMLVPPSVRRYAGIGRALGGESHGSQPGVMDDVTTEPPIPSRGTNVIGRLVTAWGQVKDGGLGGVGYIWIDDGSQLNDGQESGIRVDLTAVGGSIPQPLPGYCVITGIMRCMTVESASGRVNVRALWPRKAADIIRYMGSPPP